MFGTGAPANPKPGSGYAPAAGKATAPERLIRSVPNRRDALAAGSPTKKAPP
jgi:hypothetical protein